MLSIKRILVPVDFSDEAELAIEWAVRLAREEKGAKIVLLHNLAPIIMLPESGYDTGKLIDARTKTAKKDLQSWLKKVPAPLTAMGIFSEEDLDQAVASVCKKENIDLVVMTTQGRQGLSRMIHPNVTEKIVRTSPCPVLVLHRAKKMKIVKEVAS